VVAPTLKTLSRKCQMLPIKFSTPSFRASEALYLAETLYGLTGAINVLPGERDQNFYLQTETGDYVLKIAEGGESLESLELQTQTLQRLAQYAPHLALPRVIATQSGATLTPIQSPNGTTHLVRLVSYVPGRLWVDCKPRTVEMLYSLGEVLGTLDRALADFDHPAAHRPLKWDLAQSAWIADYISYIENPVQRFMVKRHLERFQQLQPQLSQLRTSIIYNDANDANILVEAGNAPARKVIGVIDFGDMVHSYTVGELAIACAYALMGQPDPLDAATHIVAGYHHAYPLTENELEVLYPLICLRLAVSVTNSAYQRVVEANNPYLVVSEDAAWALLDKLADISPNVALTSFRLACGLPASPNSAQVTGWLKANSGSFSAIIRPDLSNAMIFDLSVGSLELGTQAEFETPSQLADRLNTQLISNYAAIGVGRYNEARPFYTNDAGKIESTQGPEWATIHLGLDFFVQVDSPFYAPLSGVIHYIDLDSATPSLILRHTVEQDGVSVTFFTLYRHVQPDSLMGWGIGAEVAQDTCLGAVGGFPSALPIHLHFQVITDLLGLDAAFPGLVPPSQRAVWLGLCPNPNLIVGLPTETMDRAELEAGEILEIRRQHLGRNLSIAYKQPVHIVRGYLQHLYDNDGRRYLDAVNNVPHVGHSHPRVVKAAQAQMAVLNTNSRYLHSNIVRYAQRLTATLPAPLSVVYFVCSGSEANELALRLARTYTGSKETIVLDLAYHGNTNALLEVSPYKYESRGGTGRQPFIHKVAIPDTYRGEYKGEGAGKQYAQQVAQALAEIQSSGAKVSAFMAESLMGSAGQIPLAPKYLKEAYQLVRAAGGVTIADEVQTGLGRVGSHFWGFELQGVVPDIVSIGKPLGNGHPLAAVVTTPAIAEAFNNGLEYFNTFGGNPVSCAVGLAVLDVIEAEGLQAHALEVGNYFLDGLRDLKDAHPLIGDVRGSGLFLGVELVKDRTTQERALAEASYVVNRMKERGILISTDFNTLKIKPPLPFNQDNADFFVQTLDGILKEDFVRQ